jgi:hypothetical protein
MKPWQKATRRWAPGSLCSPCRDGGIGPKSTSATSRLEAKCRVREE